jgi:hypothetical protein
MMGAGIITVVVVLIAFPFALVVAVALDLAALGRMVQRRRMVPIQQRNMTRATFGAFALVICAVLAANGFPVIGWQATAGIAAFVLLYLCVGLHGFQGARFDVMSVFWWAVLALGCAALLVFRGFPL